jgi:hypothetical protein
MVLDLGIQLQLRRLVILIRRLLIRHHRLLYKLLVCLVQK